MTIIIIIGIIFIIALLFLVCLFLFKLKHLKAAKYFPGPPALPLLGNALTFAGIDHNEMIQTVGKLQMEYGSPAKIWLGPHLVISVADPENMEIIMKSSENLNKSTHHKFFSDFMDGVFLAEDERWRKHRKMMSLMFHSSCMDSHIMVFNRESVIMCDNLKDKVGKGVFDVRHVVNSCILDIICQTAMRTPMNVQGKYNNISYPDDVSHISEITMQRMTKIWLYPSVIFNRTKLGKERDILVKKIKHFVRAVIEKRRKYKTVYDDDDGPIGKFVKPYLDTMLEYGKEDKLSEDKLALEVNDLLVAGSDTSAVAVSHALVMIGMDQNLQDRLYSELTEIFGNSDRPATMDDLSIMTQLEMVVKETVRITCPPHMARNVNKDIKLFGENQVIPAGSTLYMLLYSLHRNPKYWSHPDEFFPDHFLPENEAARPKYSFLPFSYGLRICPGHKYGIYSLKVVLSTVLRRYKIITEMKPNEIKYRVAIMLELANGYLLRLEKRN